MAADITDKARKSYSLLTKSLSSNISDVDTTIPFNNVTNIPTDTAVDFIIDRVDSNGTATPSLRELCKGVVSGSNLVNCVRGLHGTTAQSHSSGAVVEFVVSAAAHNDLIDLILSEHNQSGGHTSISVSGNIDVNDSSTAIRDSSDNELVKFSKTASAVNEITIANAATGAFPTISATGEADTGIDFENSEGEEILKLDAIASAVNELTIKNAATGGGPVLQASGGDTDIPINITPKGAGKIINNGPHTNSYNFRVYHNTTQNSGNGAYADMSFNTELFDTNSNFASSIYTAPVSGIYMFGAGARVATVQRFTIQIVPSATGVTIRGSELYDDDNHAGSGSTAVGLIQLAAGDTVKVQSLANTTTTIESGSSTTYFWGYLVHAT